MPIDSCVSSYTGAAFIRINLAFEQSYSVVNGLAVNNPFMLSPPFNNQFQILYNTCTEYAIYDMISNGRFPKDVSGEFKKNKSKNYDYLQLRANNCALTFSSCNSVTPEALPRPSIFRQIQSFENQSSLFEPFEDESLHVSYGIVLHKKNGENGYAKPFVSLGIPDGSYEKWLEYRTFSEILSKHIQEVNREENEYIEHLKNEISKKATSDILPELNISLK